MAYSSLLLIFNSIVFFNQRTWLQERQLQILLFWLVSAVWRLAERTAAGPLLHSRYKIGVNIDISANEGLPFLHQNPYESSFSTPLVLICSPTELLLRVELTLLFVCRAGLGICWWLFKPVGLDIWKLWLFQSLLPPRNISTFAPCLK